MLIAEIVGRNESDRFLHQTLGRLKEQVDLICFTDDCSDDDTYEIAESYGCQMNRTPENLFAKNEGLLRSIGWQHLERFASPGDWVICIDCDEELYMPQDASQLLEQTHFEVMGVLRFEMWNETHYRADKAWAPHICTRLFRFHPNGTIRDRLFAPGSEPTYVQYLVQARKFYPQSGFRMKHLGYLRDEDKQMKYDRYMEIDGGKYHNLQHLQSILDPNPYMELWHD